MAKGAVASFLLMQTKKRSEETGDMAKVYHLDLDKKMLKGAKVALMPGDPFRSKAIAEEVSRLYGSASRELAWKREFHSFSSSVNGKPVVITSTGIGGPSTSIAIDELARLGVRTFVRVGTTGAICEKIKTGEVIISTAAVRLDGASRHYAPIEYPAVADFDVVAALRRGAEEAKIGSHTGVSASSDTFYPGEERTDSYRKYTIRALRGSTKEWQELGVLNYEMESATLFTLTASMGLKGGCITGVVNRGGTGKVTSKNLALGESNVIKAAAKALSYLV